MINCPGCGWQMRTGDVQPGRFLCPRCKIGLHVPEASGYEQAIGVLGSGILALLIPYLIGVQGIKVLLYWALLYLPMCGAMGLVSGFLFPRALKMDSPPGPRVGNILHIDDSPESQNKS